MKAANVVQALPSQAGTEVVQEVWDLVDEYHVDPHGNAFDHNRYALLASSRIWCLHSGGSASLARQTQQLRTLQEAILGF